jgi:hypothetical protein
MVCFIACRIHRPKTINRSRSSTMPRMSWVQHVIEHVIEQASSSSNNLLCSAFARDRTLPTESKAIHIKVPYNQRSDILLVESQVLFLPVNPLPSTKSMSPPPPSTVPARSRSATPAPWPGSAYGSGRFNVTAAARLPGVHLTPAASSKRRRVSACPITAGKTAALPNNLSPFLRRRATSIGAAPPRKVLQPQHYVAPSPQLSPESKMAAPSNANLTAYRRSSVPCTFLPHSMDGLSQPVEKCRLTGMPLTPPGLVTPGFGIKDAVSPH